MNRWRIPILFKSSAFPLFAIGSLGNATKTKAGAGEEAGVGDDVTTTGS